METIKKNPQKFQEYLNNQEEARSFLKQGSRLACGPGNTLVIPVAVHFNGSITNVNPGCISTTVANQIQVLNEDFGGYNADIVNYCMHSTNCPTEYPPTSLGNDACIQFCLATQNLPGGNTTGITFGQFTFDSRAAGYEGIFSIFVSDVDPAGSPPGLLGLAPLGGAANPDGNGMFITNTSFGGGGSTCMSGAPLNSTNSFDLGRTGTHEAGHYLGLKHIFEGCSNGDGIADTPDQGEPNDSTTPSIDYGTCVSTAVNSCGTQDFFFNYMDYVQDASMYMFTADQLTLMKATGDAGSSGLNPWATNTINCGNMDHTPTYPLGGCPVSAPPIAAFSDDYAGSPLCAALADINYTDQSAGFPTSWAWTFTGAGVSPSTSTEQNPTVTYSSTGTISATLIASNGAGASAPLTQMLAVAIENPANCGDCGNTFVDDGGVSGNYSATDVTYTFCASSATETVVLDFSSIILEPWSGSFGATDHIRVYDGNTATGQPANYIFSNSIYEENGSSLSPIGTIFSGTQQCVTLEFDNSGDSYPGWEADIICIPLPTCFDGIQNQGEEFVDCNGPCTACASFCDSFSFTDAGGTNNAAGVLNQEWTMCADNASDHLIVDFSIIDMAPFNNGVLRVYEGSTNNGSAYDYYISGGSIYVNIGGSLSPLGSNVITSINDCYTFYYFNGSDTNLGWEAKVNCCIDGVCPNANNAGGPVSATVSTACPGFDITNFTSFRSGDISNNRACSSPSLEYQAFYMIECDGNGGLLEVDISTNSNGGNIEVGLYGPVTGSCPSYTGGAFVDCEDGTDPAALSRMTNANELYLVVITSDVPGDFTITSSANSTALPVTYSQFNIVTKGNNAELSWITESEINNKGFDVMRSMDGVEFETVNFIEGKGTTYGSTAYTFIDYDLMQGVYYYKLSQRDFDGKMNMSDVKSIEIFNTATLTKVFPNPTNDELTIQSDGGIISVKVYNLLGQSIYVVPSEYSNEQYRLSMQSLPIGVYKVLVETITGLSIHQVVLIE